MTAPARALPCAAWSAHAADLAAPLEREMAQWPAGSPSTEGAVLDGHVLRLDRDLCIPADLARTALDRALLVGCVIGEQLRPHHVIAGRSALWVHLGGAFPRPLELLTSAHRSLVSGASVRHCTLLPEEIDVIAGAPVTSPARTCIDLMRFAPQDAAVRAVAAMLGAGLCTPAQLGRALRSVQGLRGSRRAAELLRGMEDPRARPSVDARARRFTREPCGHPEHREHPEPREGRAPGPGLQGAQARAASRPSTGLPSAVTR
ncbi:hypothetical protein Bequi_08855 [Brachybacterium sp. JHP9]|uniref:AbiEi antitoxin C-terminal domain-containing protein n=1 Tax=Brachybacterium equifaecis TaxID=2910770 RepID=A0ABT0R0Q7_9MICO|nr:hypothetical protein [Brachybacterium equifaecis]MCL6423496.1 hypothetical protein [Brachybacterium equifaecis]